MEKGVRICPILLPLLFVTVPLLTDGSPLEVMAAPNVLQAGITENIFVEIQDCAFETDVVVNLIVMNHPTKNDQLLSTAVTLNSSNSYQAFGEILISSHLMSNSGNSKRVYLQAVFPDRTLEQIVLVSFHSVHLFIQTDRHVYTPNSRVNFRIFAMTADFSQRIDQQYVFIRIMAPEGPMFVQAVAFQAPGLVYHGVYNIPDIASPGIWKITTNFPNNPQSFSTDFEVKEYAVSSVFVTLTPESTFLYKDGAKLTVNIEAKCVNIFGLTDLNKKIQNYTFGAAVNGVAFVLFGIQIAGQKKPIPSSLQRVSIAGGKGAATLERLQTFNVGELTGASIYVTATVLTDSGGDMVGTELKGIKIVTSRYSINLDKTVKHFKPGLSYDLEFQVLNPDNTPAKLVKMLVQPGSMLARTGANGFVKLPMNTKESDQKLTITIETIDPALARRRQAAATFEALPYTSATNSYIHIVANTVDVKLGDNLGVQCFIKRQEYTEIKITYLILRQSHLVKHFRRQIKYWTFISEKVPVTKEMMPSFTIIAYYHTSDNEVVSDSLRVDVKDSCIGSLHVENLRSSQNTESVSSLPLKITGPPMAAVGLMATKKGVYTKNDMQGLTQKKIWDSIKKSDMPCTLGGEYNSMSVFYEAGLLFVSKVGRTPLRGDLMCDSYNRKKRDTWDETVEDAYMDPDKIVRRTRFPQSYMWMLEFLPPCPQVDPHCKTTSSAVRYMMQDSTTNWEIFGISVSQTHGICVTEPLEVSHRRQFFIDLKPPYSAVAGEQLEIKAVLHNYTPDPITVLVHLFDTDNVCSLAYGRGKYQQEVQVEAQSSRSVPFVFIFTKEGQHSIEVTASVKESELSDGVKKMIRVVPRGELVKHTRTAMLDPARNEGKQTLQSQIPVTAMVPNAPTSTLISLKAETFSEQEERGISGDDMDALIQQPSGNGEVNMIQLTLPVVATMYLDKTKQWHRLGFNRRDEALRHIRVGYMNQLGSRKSDGSFSMGQVYPSSTWLTAYVVKVFAMANSLGLGQSSVICDAIQFLVSQTQQPDGSFREVGRVNNAEMTGDAFGADTDASITAFCLIALQEARPHCLYRVTGVISAVSYLDKRLSGLSNPYAVAMASYALANEGRLNKEILYRFASPGLNYWPVPKGHAYQLEATAYALLALVRAGALEEARPVVSWLRQQQRVSGGYTSTQATMMVYQAVAKYLTRTKEEVNNDDYLNVNVRLPGVQGINSYRLSRQNPHFISISQTIQQAITVTVTGKGRVAFQVVWRYYTWPKTEDTCQNFNVSVQLIPVSSDQVQNTYQLRIDILYKRKDRESSMAVLEIGLLAGFTVNAKDLDLVSKRRNRVVSETNNRSSLIIYLDKISHRQPEQITFRIHETLKVGILQPAAVSVYEYDDQLSCVKFYHPERVDGQLMQVCRDNDCVCAEANCCTQKSGNITIQQRTEASCKDIVGVDFAYKVLLEEFSGGLSMDAYKMTIQLIIREASYNMVSTDQTYTFISSRRCRELLNLVKGKTYLIMGQSKDIYRQPQGGHHYILREKTWLEYWPTDTECQSNQHRLNCKGLNSLVNQMSFGCPA